MNNKKLGTRFEQVMCKALAEKGFWVHFISPDARGAQPFDIIAVRDDLAVAIDCKTCEDHIFRISRLEDNQVNAFDLWRARGNSLAYIAVFHKEKIYMINYTDLKRDKNIQLDKIEAWANGVSLFEKKRTRVMEMR